MENYNNYVNKECVRCKCGTPIAKRLDSRKLEMLKYHHGKSLKINLQYEGDECSITCEKCGHVIVFKTNKITLPMAYVVETAKLPL